MTSNRAETEGLAATRGRVTVSTLLVLVAALAAGLVVTRSLPEYLFFYDKSQVVHDFQVTATGTNFGGYGVGLGGPVYKPVGRPFKERTSYWLGHIPYWSGPCLSSLTLAVTALGFHRPRPRWRRLVRTPGMVAGLAVALALVVKAIQGLLFLNLSGTPLFLLNPGWKGPWVNFWITLPGLAGYTVAASWIILALGGRWSAGSNAQERLGRAVGWCWVAIALSSTTGTWCFELGY
jgi:hypothetical protein